MNDLEGARTAARRYAQLVFYHDQSTITPRISGRAYRSWHQYRAQFYAAPRGAVMASIVNHAFATEMRRLVDASRELRSALPKQAASGEDGHGNWKRSSQAQG